jgi:hypothetical protein
LLGGEKSETVIRAQHDVAIAFALGRATYDAVVEAFGVDFRANPERSSELLDAAAQANDAAGVEVALLLGSRFGVTPKHVPTLTRLLTASWHRSHEDVALALERLHDPSAVDALFEAARETYRTLAYLEYDGGHAFARKCVWALAVIGTLDARTKLEALAQSEDSEVGGSALKALARRPPSPA